MKRILSTLFVGWFILVPVAGWSAPPVTTGNLAAQVAELQSLVASLQSQLTAETLARQAADTTLSGSVSAESSARTLGDINTLSSAKTYTDSQIPAPDSFVTNLKTYMTVDTTNNRLLFHDVNIQLVNGMGNTWDINGKGNLIIGYDMSRNLEWESECSYGLFESKEDCEIYEYVWAVNHKSGSHNLVIGDNHNYPAASGFVAGWWNTINQWGASVSGGEMNHASGGHSSVSGGTGNHAKGLDCSISGGRGNTASGIASSVSGGYTNISSGNYHSSVSGGRNNTASGDYSIVIGGNGNNTNLEDDIAP
jgi:hypothetical protein